ncbi:MAG: hypothetical protein AABY53_01335 [Bdellovibrionota bacterium]
MLKLILTFLCILSLIGSSIALAQNTAPRRAARGSGQNYTLPPDMLIEILNSQDGFTTEELNEIKRKIQASENKVDLLKIFNAYTENLRNGG